MTGAAHSQDAHFNGVQDMIIWYNPSLKTNKVPDAHASIRSVNYPNVIAYSSKAATIDLPLISRDKSADDNIFFFNLAAGIITDNSADHFLNVSTAMLSLSYALPLNDDNTCLAIGFSGNYSFNKVGFGIPYQISEGFDKYGPLQSALANDPNASGYSYGYFTAGAGVSIFHNGEQKQWYIGGSIRHINHPYTEWTHAVRQPSNIGIQAGYNAAVNNEDAFGAYINYSSQANIQQQLIGFRYTRTIDDSTNSAFSLGLGYRIGDALVPNIGLTFGQNQLAFYYELNLTDYSSGNYRRRAFEFSYKRDL